jgi:peptidoglycan/xylan/chitin deacetylase (PgdA/CDA1 family)
MDVIFQGPSDRAVLAALTIDDFPSSGADQSGSGSMALLDLLGELAIPATFFAIGPRVQKHPGMAARAVEGGHELGNHMWGEDWSITLGREAFLKELDHTSAAIKGDLADAGQTAPLRWFRPSGGWFHPSMPAWARSRGYRTVLGSIWPLDGLGIAPPEQAQRWFVERSAHPGGIVVLHDTTEANPATRRTLQSVVPELQQKGFSFVTLSTLLGPG